MIPGTAKETAKLALAAMGMRNNIAGLYAYRDAERALSLAERREFVARGELPGSSQYAHAVALASNIVFVPTNVRNERAGDIALKRSVERALEETAVGDAELWFREDGEAFISFEFEEDATLFRLALD